MYNSPNKIIRKPETVYPETETETAIQGACEKDFDLDTTLSDLYRSYQFRAGNNTIELLNGSGKSPYTVIIRSDKVRLVEVLSNLLDNAVRFTRAGLIRFGYSVCGSSIVFFVYDTGIGIPYECQPKVFDRYYKAEQSAGAGSGGTGLGLTVCRENVELLGGRIWLRSEPGKWTIFFFTIPFKPLGSRDI